MYKIPICLFSKVHKKEFTQTFLYLNNIGAETVDGLFYYAQSFFINLFMLAPPTYDFFGSPGIVFFCNSDPMLVPCLTRPPAFLVFEELESFLDPVVSELVLDYRVFCLWSLDSWFRSTRQPENSASIYYSFSSIFASCSCRRFSLRKE